MKFHALLARTLLQECLFTIIMSLKRKRSVLSIKDKQAITLRLEKEEKGTNLSSEYGFSKRQIGKKGKVTLFNVGSSFSYEASINGSRRCALYPPPSVSAPFYGYLKL